ncbi:MAG TPA: hydrogenase, partial [Plasticicumulans sp.]|nr:hydrogenase [Plasticicumulans sp.]
ATRLLALWMELRADWGRVQRGTGAAALLRAYSPRPGVGLAQVECARGTLTHRVALDGPLVTGWRVLAPTEWNFHPRGPLADAIATLPAQSDADATRAAETLAAALDPCVRIALRMTADA